MARDEIWEYLDCIDPSTLTYDEWLAVGMGLNDGGYGVEVFDEWSARDTSLGGDGKPRYKGLTDCAAKYASFTPGGGVTLRSVYKMAYERGCKYKAENARELGVKDCPVDYDFQIGGYENDRLHLPPWGQLVKYIETLYKPDDIIGYCTKFYNKNGRDVPDDGVYDRTAGEILEILKSTNRIEAAVGDLDEKNGAYIRLNTYDGKGASDSNCVTFRYALVECDSGSVKEQEDMYRGLKLPIAALVMSGGKSLHAIVKVDAVDVKEYRKRVRYLQETIAERGNLKTDTSVTNPSRYSRMPGVMRDGFEQTLVDVETGLRTWQDWQFYITVGRVPNEIRQPLQLTEKPKLADELIPGVLRVGHKMLIAGASKAGKSFFMEELAIAISQGYQFLDMQMKQAKVLYINLEIDDDSCTARIMGIRDELYPGCNDPEGNLDTWGLRGRAQPLEELVNTLIRYYKERKYKVIMVDPIYKVMQGDENSASDMGAFTNQFDRLCAALDCTAIYAHHHSKAAADKYTPLDRMSGSGVFARDNDAIIDMAELDIEDIREAQGWSNDASGWELTFITREFKRRKPLRVLFDGTHSIPVDKFDREHKRNPLDSCRLISGQNQRPKRPTSTKKDEEETEDGTDDEEKYPIGQLEKLVFIVMHKAGVTEMGQTELAQKLSEVNPGEEGYQTEVNSKRQAVMRLCKKSKYFAICDKKVTIVCDPYSTM